MSHSMSSKESSHTCPWWLIGSFDNPLRKLVHDPERMLAPWVQPGATVLDVGCGMGYFSLGLARLVGPQGRVIAADLQDEMLKGLLRRAVRAGLQERIQVHLSRPDRIGVEVPVDFILTFWMVHEVNGKEAFLRELFAMLKPGGRYLLVEPLLHVSEADFDRTVALIRQVGFQEESRPTVRVSRAVLFHKPA